MYGEPLNPKLYQALERVFRYVQIANPGETYIASRRPSFYRPGRMEAPPAFAGEYYCVSCLDCSDTRQRLWINHMWGVRDPETGDDRLYVIRCYNEGCFNTRERQEKLYDKLFPFNYNARMRLCELAVAATNHDSVPAAAIAATLPDPMFPLTDPACQVACHYLASRGFDSQEIAERWQVGFCFNAPVGHYSLSHRLIIPVYTLAPSLDHGPVRTLAGWQARSLNDDGPKYLSMMGMRKSHVLYGLIEAISTTGPIIVVEGSTDVWRFGTNAVATLGKSISPAQIQLLLRHFNGRPIGVMYDTDAAMEGRLTATKIRDSRREWSDTAPVIDIPVPAGRKDAGECSQAELWAAIRRGFPDSPTIPLSTPIPMLG